MFMHIFRSSPWNPVFKLQRGPWPKFRGTEGGDRPKSGRSSHRWRGEVGEELEDANPYLLVSLDGVGAAEDGPSTKQLLRQC